MAALPETAAKWLRIRPGAVEVDVRVVPRSSRDRIAGVLGDRLKLQVTSPPVEGEANRAVLELLARSAGLPLRSATLVVGQTGRSKTVRIECEDPAAVAERLGKAAGPPG
ncbi:MAG: DUF167 domain-containing protein [Candidatus Binatia bacterium]